MPTGEKEDTSSGQMVGLRRVLTRCKVFTKEISIMTGDDPLRMKLCKCSLLLIELIERIDCGIGEAARIGSI